MAQSKNDIQPSPKCIYKKDSCSLRHIRHYHLLAYYGFNRTEIIEFRNFQSGLNDQFIFLSQLNLAQSNIYISPTQKSIFKDTSKYLKTYLTSKPISDKHL